MPQSGRRTRPAPESKPKKTPKGGIRPGITPAKVRRSKAVATAEDAYLKAPRESKDARSIAYLVTTLANRTAPRTEAMVQADVRQLLLSAPLNLTDDVLLESQVGDRRRIDVEVGATVIEVKKDLRVGNTRDEAVSQLAGYVESRQRKHGRRYVGILTDGSDWICYHLVRGELVEVTRHVTPATPDVDKLLVWLEGVLATTRDIKPTPDEITRRLGSESSAYKLDRATMAALYAQHKNVPTVRTKRRLWARLLETALGTQFEDSDDLFVEHTLLVNTAEIIAHAVVGLSVETIDPTALLAGTEFDKSGIFGVVEADFFDWVVEVPGGEPFVRTLARRTARFDWSEVEHDVLKVLYESVISAETRKKLGEYYTPDWLAQKVTETAITDPLKQRVLDPACGSGTFLFHSVRRYMSAAEVGGLSASEMLEGVTHRVLGMDLHPVAVTLARVTYLLAIGRGRLQIDDRPVIQVPVYLGDSMQWQQKNANLWSSQHFTISAEEEPNLFPAKFSFPSALLKDTRIFDELVKVLADKAASKTRTKGSKPPSLKGVYERLEIPAEMHGTIDTTFALMCRLHDEGRDHIWGYYIRNQARPEWLSLRENRVDVLVGNPPWLAYRFMPARMQRDFQEMSRARALWAGAKHATQQDLSALFAVRMVEQYLADDGRFGFVMPNAVLDRGQYSGFQKGTFDRPEQEVRVKFGTPWDLRRLRPHFFPRGSAVVFGARAATSASIPKDMEIWSGRLPDPKGNWDVVGTSISRGNATGAPSAQSETSPYHPRFRNGATVIPRVLFMVEKVSAGPLGQAAGRVSVRSARSSYEKAPWKSVRSLEGVVEKQFIRPVHLGETILPFRPLPACSAVFPRDRDGILDARSERIERYPGFAEWWREAERCWDKHRSSSRLNLVERLDFQKGFQHQFPIPKQRVVYAKSGMHVAAARLRDSNAVIDHTLYWAEAASDEEAHFLCSVLNAAVTTRLVRPFMPYGKDERHVDKYIWKLPIPLYDETESLHVKLAALGEKAEQEIAALALEGGRHFAAARRMVREYLATSETGKSIEKLVAELLAPKS